MIRGEVLEILNQIFAKVLNNSTIKLDYEMTANDVDGWDSITNMTIINEVEKHFNIRFKLREIVKTKNVGDFCDTILGKMD